MNINNPPPTRKLHRSSPKKRQERTSHRNSDLPTTSWQNASRWYDNIVGEEGHYYHTHVIFPKLKKLLDIQKNDSIIDVGCGEGVFSRHLSTHAGYVGIDISKNLIQSAKEKNKNDSCQFLVHDALLPFPIDPTKKFSHATCILAMQNMLDGAKVCRNISCVLQENGLFALCLNHPSFRIPRQSGWGFDEKTQQQFRKMFSYMQHHTIPILTHPGKDRSSTTFSFHDPISTYSTWLHEAGFVIEIIEEWCSDKVSSGKAAPWENRARKEFPLFLTILSRRVRSPL